MLVFPVYHAIDSPKKKYKDNKKWNKKYNIPKKTNNFYLHTSPLIFVKQIIGTSAPNILGG